MRPSASPADHPGAARPRRSRRWFLAGGAAVVAGGGAGVAAGLLRPRSHRAARPAPAALIAAITAERELLSLASAAARSDPTVRVAAATVTGNHRAHLRALQSALAAYDRPPARPAAAPSLTATPSVRAQLRLAERAAAGAAATRADQLTGSTATLLASIAACEASHAELLAG